MRTVLAAGVMIAFIASPIAGGVALGAAAIGIGALRIRLGRKARWAIGENARGQAALARGRFDEAGVIFENLVRDTEAWLPAMAAIACHNLAWTAMRQGNMIRALELLKANETAHLKELTALALSVTSALDLAINHALLGELDAAARSLRDSETRARGQASANVSMAIFAHALVDCRAGRADDAAKLLDERWAECEAVTKGSELRPLRVMRAFAIASSGPRDAGQADAILAPAKPLAYRGEYAFLGSSWPEMAAFLAAHDLA